MRAAEDRGRRVDRRGRWVAVNAVEETNVMASRHGRGSRRIGMIRSAVALGLIAAAVAAAACGSSSDSASTPTQSGATKGKVYPGTINVSFPFLPIVQFYPLELGADYGVFKKYGLNVKVKIVNDAAINAA